MPAAPVRLSNVDRWLAACGIVGVVGFVTAWITCGVVRDGYSPVDDAISELAEVGASGRVWMTVGFVVFGIGVPLYACALRVAVSGPAWIAAIITGLATLGVAATPLGGADAAHGAFAVVGYASLAMTPLLAAPTFRRAGADAWARASIACGVGSAVLLVASTFDQSHGATQRLGLLVTDAWIVATAWSMCRHGELPRRQRSTASTTVVGE